MGKHEKYDPKKKKPPLLDLSNIDKAIRRIQKEADDKLFPPRKGKLEP